MFIFEELMRFILMPCGPIPSPPCATSHALAGGGSIEDEGRRTGVQPRRSPGPRGRWLPGIVSPMKRATLQERIWPFAVSQRSVCEPHSSLCISTSPVIASYAFSRRRRRYRAEWDTVSELITYIPRLLYMESSIALQAVRRFIPAMTMTDNQTLIQSGA